MASQLRGGEPIRLFRSDFLERFSHVSPAAVVAIWAPVFAFLVTWSVLTRPEGFPLPILLGLPAAWLVWTLVEYLMHRFIFHYHPRTERLQRAVFLFHGVHHAQPLCKTRLVMPPAMSVPLSFLFFGLFYLVLVVLAGARAWFLPAFAGFVLGYLIYDLLHYGLHHGRFKGGYLAMCRFQHMQHHGTCPAMRYGVSSPLWDYVFGTMPEERFRRARGRRPAPRRAAD